MSGFSVATQWDLPGSIELLECFDKHTKLNNVYGALAFNPIGHGRSPYSVPNVSELDVKAYIKEVQRIGITFNYLLNGNFNPEKIKNKEYRDTILKYLEKLVNEYEVRYVTVAVPELVSIINDYFPEVSVKVSTIYNALSVDDLKKIEGLRFKKVTLGNDAPRNITSLKKMIEYTKKKDFELELMVTETCVHSCSTRSSHYRKQTEDTSDYSTDWYMNQCILKRLRNPEEFLKACWVRPENLRFYEELGIESFKISGRSKNLEWTKLCITSYVNRKYNGNIMDILGTTPPDFETNSAHLVFINNNRLSDFFACHPLECDKLKCEECRYCKEEAIKLFLDGDFKVNPICGTYSIGRNGFEFEPGPYAQKLYSLIEAKKGL